MIIGRPIIKLGLLAVAMLEIASIFYLLHIYNQFVSNPINYYKNILAHTKDLEK